MKIKYEIVEFESGGYGVRKTNCWFGLVTSVEFICGSLVLWRVPEHVTRHCIFSTKEEAIDIKNRMELKYKVIQ
jgi:hypothetical protein